MSGCDIIKEFLNHLEPENVPFEYLASASIKDRSGNEVVLKGEQLKRLLNNDPLYSFVNDARIYINIGKVMDAINLEVDYVYEKVHNKFLKASGE